MLQEAIRSSPPASPAVVFEARGLTKAYRMGEAEVYALRGADLELYEGEFVVLLGPAGSGKSTLLNILGGLDTPTAGVVRFRDHELTTGDDVALTLYRREHVGFIFQSYNLIPSLTARENVALVTEIAADPMSPEEALRLVGLGTGWTTFRRKCQTASSSAWRSRGPIVLANRELGTTTAVITHNAIIADMADRVISISDGRVAAVRRNNRKASAAALAW